MLSKFKFLVFLLISIPAFSQYRFIENKNQWDAQAKFRAELPGGYLFLEEQGLTYLFHDPNSFPQHHGHKNRHGFGPNHAKATRTNNSPTQGVRGHVVKVHFIGANEHPSFDPAQATPGHYNFLLGNNPSKWGKKAKAYQEINYRELYPHVDLKFYNYESELKYEFIVAPQGDAGVIKMEYEGQDKLYLENGNLYIQTSVNAFREAKPYCYQLIGDLTLEVPSEFRLEGNQVVFHFPEGYDSNYPLVIDPTLVFASYSGSPQDNWGFTAAPDDEGHLYAGGISRESGQFPTTTGAFQETGPNQGSSTPDIAIMKYSPDGTQIEYATYLGGTQMDVPHSLIVNSQNQLIILGTTSSSDFPMTFNSYDNTFAGGPLRTVLNQSLTFNAGTDMFVSILNEDGSNLEGSTYFGGIDSDGLNPQDGSSDLSFNYGDEMRGDIILDENDNIYLCSVTNSPDLPVTNNTYQSNLEGSLDAVVAKFNSNVSSLIWSTYLGGVGEESAYGIKLDASNNVIITGGTTSTDFPTTPGVINQTYQGGSVDGFITILNSAGNNLIASTFLGTDRYDQSYLVDLDEFGNIGVFGQTTGLYTVSDPALYSVPRAGQFIHKLSPDLRNTIFSTVVGTESPFSSIAEINIRPTAFLINSCSHIYLAGWGGEINDRGSTNGLPVTDDAVQLTTDGSDFYLMILSADATRLLYATFYGATSGPTRGEHVDGGTSRFDKNGAVYQSVCSCGGSGFPTTAGVVSQTNNSTNCNNAVFKFDLESINADVNPTIPDDGGVFVSGDEGCAPLQVMFTNDSLIGNEFEWDFGDGTTLIADAVNVIHTYQTPGVYPVSVRVVDSATCQIEDVAIDTITVFAANFTAAGDASICEGESTPLSASGGINYNWTPATGLDDPTSATPIATPSETTTYTVTSINADGCEFEEDIRIEVRELDSSFDTVWQSVCDTLPELRVIRNSSSTAQTYSWFLNGDPFTPSPPANFEIDFEVSDNYQLILQTDNNGCMSADTIEFDIVFNNEAIVIDLDLADPTTICQGDTVPLFARGGVAYQWTPANSLDDPTSPDPIAVPDETTDYQVRIFSGKEGCILDTTILITVIPEVQLDFGYEWNEAECGELPTVGFFNNSTNTEQFTWTIDGQQFTGRIPPVYVPTGEDTIAVTLVAGDPLCPKTDSIEVPIVRFGVPPNAFSPNGDGINDTFEIIGLGSGWSIAIYNRWGKLVYESANYQGDWAGEDNAGEAFYYLLTSPAGNTCKGYINVLKGTD
ncbi:MAG: gliding motility-associated C-terminal domain-containing protein [Flammeovirgaceae bacterium]